jgi:AmpE protein
MIFLVVLITLLLNYYWRRERSLPVDAWFERWQQWLLAAEERLPNAAKGWSGTLPMLALLVPLIPLAILLWLAHGRLFGLLSVGIHVVVLMYCMARINVNELVDEYLALWRHGNFEAAYHHVSQRVPGGFGRPPEDYALMHQQFLDHVLLVNFRRLFAVLFWYILLGPLAALFYFLLQQVLKTGKVLTDRASDAMAKRLQAILEWVPARLLCLAFALAGDFVASFNRLRERFGAGLDSDRNIALLRVCSLAAIGKADSDLREADYSRRAAWELESLRDLMLRTQFVWVIVLALAILVV